MHDAVLTWYSTHARDLPWRSADRTPWGVLVSEIMLQQTPVARVEPVWRAWIERWPEPASLAADEPGEAIRAWGRLGYPRRALRLHAAAGAIVERHDGRVPSSYDALIALPGIGEYTAAAVASFAFGQRHTVLDTNVRRVLARVVDGRQYPPASTTAAERRAALDLLPEAAIAPTWSVAVMELGALVCTARSPRCEECPLRATCAWRHAGSPPHDGPPRRAQAWAGTDRQVRGRLMAVLREAEGPVPKARLDETWPDAVQRERALDGLVADGLVEPVEGHRYRLPVTTPQHAERAT
ncbi:A/G-specific adenine glycosylase [Phytoactinopolyspora alkaliphila]|uniref:Adenine DNA glycosylase n=1 Tax=Phytoactinopolyspora alkaliphila TaxID=1783498 RepID=A0A6N9YJ76_9ACTN|nr:A/G-specific adenine glycosylase [Phytoactinopolyspora alkaliphila]NED94985.1 A/G-specific adenine glycosylase [Phytoactinopolyspora alkaliphila]